MKNNSSFQNNFNQPNKNNYSHNYNHSDLYSNKKYGNPFIKDFKKEDNINNLQQTYYTTNKKKDYLGLNKIQQKMNKNIRETYSYSFNYNYTKPHNDSSLIRTKIQDFSFRNNLSKTTVDLKSIQENSNQNLQYSQYTPIKRYKNKNKIQKQKYYNSIYVKSQPNISNNYQNNNFKQKIQNNSLNFQQSNNCPLKGINKLDILQLNKIQLQIKRLKQEKQKQTLLRKNIQQKQQQKHIKSISQVFQDKQKYKYSIQYYTPKVQKIYKNHSFNSNNISPNSLKFQKQTSLDLSIESPTVIKPLHIQKIQINRNHSYKSDYTRLPTKRNRNTIKLQDFFIQRKIGQGRFGKVYLAFHKHNRSVFAIKKINKQMIRANKLINQFILETKLQSYFDHPYILKIYGIFDDAENIYIIMEYLLQGTLFQYFKKLKRLPQEDVAQKVRYLAEAIQYLQQRGVAHRDIKPQNIIMSNDVCKLADFGWATFCDQQRRKTYVGTFDYVAPQILDGQQYDQTVDLWCMGVLTYQLLIGKAPFYHISRRETMKKIMNAKIQYPEGISYQIKSFINGLIQKQPSQRMTISEVLLHPFLRQINLQD